MSDETSSSSSPTTSDGSLYPEIPRNAVQIAEQLGVGTFGSGSVVASSGQKLFRFQSTKDYGHSTTTSSRRSP